MLRTFKIVFIVLGLGIFIFPKQMVFAQNITENCDQKSSKEDCCNAELPQSCHSKNASDSPQKEDCADDCHNCHSCTVHYVMNFLSPEIANTLSQNIFALQLNFNYGISYFSSAIQNIWQPPKIV